MKFYSTNNRSKPVDFKTALLRGLADDGGLFMPEKFTKSKSFFEAISSFIDIPKKQLEEITADAFNFPAPLAKLDDDLYILELFHGPTLSFKDFGARFMARAMNYHLGTNNKQQAAREPLNIIVATSGDTGSAVASAFYGLKNINVFVLYPSKRISPLQEKQIATFGKNIYALEVQGNFDDCQSLAKTALADHELRRKINLSSANSINIGRLLPQMFYYFEAVKQIGKQPTFVVPSGNFGNLTAGLFAKKCGLPVKKFIAAVNKNSIIPKYLKTGKLKPKKTEMTYSSAMDVGLPSNWARIRALYDNDHDDDKTRKNILKDVEAITISEAKTKKTIRDIYKKYGYIADPHTAVGIAATMTRNSTITRHSGPVIVLATAHPAKFKEIVESAIGRKISLPRQLSEIAKKSKKSVLVGKHYSDLRRLLAPNV